MAVKTQPLAALQQENAKITRDKTIVPKSGGLNVQQPALSDRKALVTITNKLKSPNSGLATSICPHKAENNTKVGASGSFSCAENGRVEIVARAALDDITNGVISFKAPKIAAKQRKG